MAVTTNLNLYLSSEDDYVSNERDLNDNFEKIDEAFGEFGEVIENSGTATYATWRSYHIRYGSLCIFSVEFTPRQNISSSVGDINMNLPAPRSGSAVFPVTQKTLAPGSTVSDYTNRYVAVTAANARAVGAYSSGTVYTASGAYVI